MFSCWKSKTNTHHEPNKPSINQRFNFIIAGSTGSGKTTLCRELLRHHFPKVNIEIPLPHGELSEITEVGRGQIVDGDTQTTITVLDTPPTSGMIYSRNSIETIEEYIETQHQIYEKRKRSNCPNYQANDTRVHCCIFICAPNRFTISDRQFILRYHWKVPIVPVISKVDTLTRSELARQIKVMVNIFDEHGVRVFDFGEDERSIDVSWIDRLAICDIAIHLRRYRRFLKERGYISNDDMGGGNNKWNYSMVEKMMLDTSSYRDIRKILSGDSRDNLLYQERGKHIASPPKARNIFSIVSNDYRSHLVYSDTPRLYGLLFEKETLRRLQLRAEVRDPRWLEKSYEIHPARGIFYATIISCTFTFIIALYLE